MRKHYGTLRGRLLEGIRASRAGVEVFEEDAGLHFMLRTGSMPDPAAFCAALSVGGLRVSHLPRYFIGSPDPAACRSFVIDYGNLEEQEIPAVLRRLEDLIPRK